MMTTLGLAASAVLLAGACAQPPAEPRRTDPAATPEKQPMSTVNLSESIKRKDWRAVESAEGAGPSAVPSIEPFVTDKDMVVRSLAVDCLAAAGGPKAQELMIRALSDKSEQVRIAAVNGLHAHPPEGKQKELLDAWDKAGDQRDGYVRQQVPMILGRVGKPEAVPEIRRRRVLEQREFVVDGMVSGMARLGDANAQKEVGRTLRDASGKRIAEFSTFVTYIDQEWTLPYLLPVLDHREEALELSTHKISYKRRGVDVAVDEVLRLKPKQFQIARDTTGNYTDKQINEVREFLKTLPPAQY